VRPSRAKKILLGALLAAAASLAIPLPASGAQFETFVGCDDLTAAPIPSHVCRIGDSPGAFFESDEDTEYEVCVEFPDRKLLCREGQLAVAGLLLVNPITTNLLGDHLVSWFVEDDEVGSWDFRMDPRPPPPVATPPALPSPTVVPAGPSLACLKARHRVRKLKASLRKAGRPEQRARIRAKLSSARAAAKRAC
jgi:hypothetical protein